jgi:hypothetical protein
VIAANRRAQELGDGLPTTRDRPERRARRVRRSCQRSPRNPRRDWRQIGVARLRPSRRPPSR